MHFWSIWCLTVIFMDFCKCCTVHFKGMSLLASKDVLSIWFLFKVGAHVCALLICALISSQLSFETISTYCLMPGDSFCTMRFTRAARGFQLCFLLQVSMHDSRSKDFPQSSALSMPSILFIFVFMYCRRVFRQSL